MFGKRDPVCGVKVSKKTKYVTEYAGKTYYFDCEACKSTFEGNPERFAKAKSGRRLLKPPSQNIPKCCHDMKEVTR